MNTLLAITLTVLALVASIVSLPFNYASAIFDSNAPGSHGVKGAIIFTSKHNVIHIDVKFLAGLPAENGPYAYHVHQNPVAENGDCASTGDHIDLETNPNSFNCTAEPNKNKCQAGDLSGKYGKMTPVNRGPFTKYSNSYDDKYLQWDLSHRGIVHRSIVIHNKDAARIACASIIQK